MSIDKKLLKLYERYHTKTGKRSLFEYFYDDYDENYITQLKFTRVMSSFIYILFLVSNMIAFLWFGNIFSFLAAYIFVSCVYFFILKRTDSLKKIMNNSSNSDISFPNKKYSIFSNVVK